jgi:hypothetical protein
MSALHKPNTHIKNVGRLQESYSVKKVKLERKKLAESKELIDRVHPENEEYSAPHDIDRA